MKRAIWIIVGVLCCLLAVTLLLWRGVGPSRFSPEAAPPNPAQKDDLKKGSQAPAAMVANPRFLTNNLPPRFITILGQGPERDFRTRLNAIHQLGHQLSLDERTVLYEYLTDPTEDPWLRPGQGNALKNDILNALCEQEQLPPELTDFLIAFHQNNAQPLVLRDYALQHLTLCYAKTNVGLREKIVEALLAAAQETNQSYAGTALLTLHRIQYEYPAARVSLPGDLIRTLIENPGANLLARISAVQLAGELGLRDEAERIRRIATDESAPNTLRIAAVGALGLLAQQDDLSLLGELPAAGDTRLRLAAESVRRRLEPPERRRGGHANQQP